MIKKPAIVSATAKKPSTATSKSFTTSRPSIPSSKLLDKSVYNPEKQENIFHKEDEATKKIKAHWAAIRAKFQHHVANVDQEDAAALDDHIPPQQILKQINLARTNPKEYILHVKNAICLFIQQKKYKKNGVTVNCSSTCKQFYQKTIEFLQNQQPLQPLKLSQILTLSASDLVIDLIGSQLYSFEGSDKSQSRDRIQRRAGKPVKESIYTCLNQVGYYEGPHFAREAVIRWITDHDDTKAQSNRSVLFSKNYKYFGVSMLKQPKKGYKICAHYCQKNHPVALLDGHNFTPIYKSIEQTKSEIIKSMDAQRNHVITLRKKFDQFSLKQIQQQKIKPLPNFYPYDDLIFWCNEARTKPKQFSKHIQNQLQKLTSDKEYKVQNTNVKCIQGKSAYIQAIEFLNKQPPLPALKYNQCLCFSAGDHLMDMIMNRFFQHQGSDKSTPKIRIQRRCSNKIENFACAENCGRLAWFQKPSPMNKIIKYIIDEGVPTRGHRNNIFNQKMKYVGACMIKDPTYGMKDVMNFSSQDLQCLNKQGGTKGIVYHGQKKIQEEKIATKEDKPVNKTEKAKIDDFESELVVSKNIKLAKIEQKLKEVVTKAKTEPPTKANMSYKLPSEKKETPKQIKTIFDVQKKPKIQQKQTKSILTKIHEQIKTPKLSKIPLTKATNKSMTNQSALMTPKMSFNSSSDLLARKKIESITERISTKSSKIMKPFQLSEPSTTSKLVPSMKKTSIAVPVFKATASNAAAKDKNKTEPNIGKLYGIIKQDVDKTIKNIKFTSKDTPKMYMKTENSAKY